MEKKKKALKSLPWDVWFLCVCVINISFTATWYFFFFFYCLTMWCFFPQPKLLYILAPPFSELSLVLSKLRKYNLTHLLGWNFSWVDNFNVFFKVLTPLLKRIPLNQNAVQGFSQGRGCRRDIYSWTISRSSNPLTHGNAWDQGQCMTQKSH